MQDGGTEILSTSLLMPQTPMERAVGAGGKSKRDEKGRPSKGKERQPLDGLSKRATRKILRHPCGTSLPRARVSASLL